MTCTRRVCWSAAFRYARPRLSSKLRRGFQAEARDARSRPSVQLFIATLAITIFATQSASSAEPLKIKIGYQTLPDKFLPMSFHRHDIAPHAGVDYDVEPTRFTSSSVEVTALDTGDIDIATLWFSSFGIAIENARMDDLRLIADQRSDKG